MFIQSFLWKFHLCLLWCAWIYRCWNWDADVSSGLGSLHSVDFLLDIHVYIWWWSVCNKEKTLIVGLWIIFIFLEKKTQIILFFAMFSLIYALIFITPFHQWSVCGLAWFLFFSNYWLASLCHLFVYMYTEALFAVNCNFNTQQSYIIHGNISVFWISGDFLFLQGYAPFKRSRYVLLCGICILLCWSGILSKLSVWSIGWRYHLILRTFVHIFTLSLYICMYMSNILIFIDWSFN